MAASTETFESSVPVVEGRARIFECSTSGAAEIAIAQAALLVLTVAFDL